MDEQTHTYHLDEQVGYWLRLASQRHTMIFAGLMAHKLTPMQFSTLIRLAENQQCSQNQLGRLAGMDVATIKGVVDRLVHKGLIETKPDQQDKRRSVISLSEAGQSLVVSLHELGAQITAETLELLTATERKTLLKLLKKIA
jgi:DNA-binding MarR family transcriptional regulator